MKHYYKGYIMKKNGCSKTPWNIYKIFSTTTLWVGFGKTLKQCKYYIDDNCFSHITSIFSEV